MVLITNSLSSRAFWIFLPIVIKIDPYILKYTVSKLMYFLRHSVCMYLLWMALQTQTISPQWESYQRLVVCLRRELVSQVNTQWRWRVSTPITNASPPPLHWLSTLTPVSVSVPVLVLPAARVCPSHSLSSPRTCTTSCWADCTVTAQSSVCPTNSARLPSQVPHSRHYLISRPTPRLLFFVLCLEWINGT